MRCFEHKLVNKVCGQCSSELYFPSNKLLCINCGGYRQKILVRFEELEVE